MNIRVWTVAASLVAAAFLSAGPAGAAPLISGCTDNGNGTQTCNFYETDANGAPSEISSPVFNVFASTTGWHLGYSAVVDADQKTLSDIIVWSPVNGSSLAEQGVLYSCDDGNLPNNCDTTGLTLLGTGYEDVNGDLLGAGKARFTFAGGPAGPDILNIYSGPELPEPITLSLFGAGLAGAAALRRRKSV